MNRKIIGQLFLLSLGVLEPIANIFFKTLMDLFVPAIWLILLSAATLL
jgi:hypothetical protein